MADSGPVLRYPSPLFPIRPCMSDLDRYDTIRAIAFTDGQLRLLDQRRLPMEEICLTDCRNASDVATAIRNLSVRGGALRQSALRQPGGVVLEAQRLAATGHAVSLGTLDPVMRLLNAARPTAVNLAWALRRMGTKVGLESDSIDVVQVLTREAQSIQDEDLLANRHIWARSALPAVGQRWRRRSHPLQYRLAGHCRIRNRARRDPSRLRQWSNYTSIRRRNATLATGRAADHVGAGARWHSGAADCRFRRGAPDEIRCRAMGDCRRRPHCRQWRYGEQDRHLSTRDCGAPSRCEIHGGGAVIDRGRADTRRSADRHRVARPGRSCSRLATGASSWTARTRGIRCST